MTKYASFITWFKFVFTCTDNISKSNVLLITFPSDNEFKTTWTCKIQGLEDSH